MKNKSPRIKWGGQQKKSADRRARQGRVNLSSGTGIRPTKEKIKVSRRLGSSGGEPNKPRTVPQYIQRKKKRAWEHTLEKVSYTAAKKTGVVTTIKRGKRTRWSGHCHSWGKMQGIAEQTTPKVKQDFQRGNLCLTVASSETEGKTDEHKKGGDQSKKKKGQKKS